MGQAAVEVKIDEAQLKRIAVFEGDKLLIATAQVARILEPNLPLENLIYRLPYPPYGAQSKDSERDHPNTTEMMEFYEVHKKEMEVAAFFTGDWMEHPTLALTELSERPGIFLVRLYRDLVVPDNLEELIRANIFDEEKQLDNPHNFALLVPPGLTDVANVSTAANEILFHGSLVLFNPSEKDVYGLAPSNPDLDAVAAGKDASESKYDLGVNLRDTLSYPENDPVESFHIGFRPLRADLPLMSYREFMGILIRRTVTASEDILRKIIDPNF